MATLVASADSGTHLALWFGPVWLAWLREQPEPGGVLRAALDRDIATLDAMISRQLDAVLHHPRLRRLEGSWRGLHWLVERLPASGGRTRVKMLHARWAEVCRDIERAIEFDQSHLFRKIHEEEFGMAGGEPFGLIAGDYEVWHRLGPSHPTDDIGALTGLASIAAASFSPMILGAAPELLGVDSFAEISPSFDPAGVLQGLEHQRWRQSTAQEDLRFIGIVLPRVLGRAPWVDDGSRVDRFRYRSHSPGPAQRVWTSPVYGFAAVTVRAFERYSWPAEVRGADISDEANGGVLDDLPFERFYSDLAHEAPARAPLEVAFTDGQENQLSDAGLIPLSALDGLPEACFGALPSLHRPPRMSTAIAQANQRISAQLNTLLCVSRFAHCVKLMGRDMTGSFMDPNDVESHLQKWLNRFISGGGLSSAEVTARYPLQEARVEVRERRGRPGVYNCTVHLKPHHQLDEIGASFRLVTEFAQRNAST
ncbi:type VI secretion system contractile sheath large subunit [Aquabacterium sp.]|uniref:type VI secretion system contractile sheath large subunit n=1 Tax=Aquabacterium sp. TaxID=1872578 RepID=UPI002BF9B6F3|nr:type VI secretion system contractile sheath large subunit [Aquabacterium sp.]HSW03542.1 type VI secretion system contractile sheath large subunit [Aquabacterium sp.]